MKRTCSEGSSRNRPVNCVVIVAEPGFSMPRSEIHMAGCAWLAGPVPIIFSNIVWIKMHPLLGVSHSLGWLARFIISGLIAGWMPGVRKRTSDATTMLARLSSGMFASIR